jgi:hypothetical protein
MMKKKLNPLWYDLSKKELKRRIKREDNVFVVNRIFIALSYLDWIHKCYKDRIITDEEVLEYITNIDLLLKGEYDFIWKRGVPCTVFPYYSPERKDKK